MEDCKLIKVLYVTQYSGFLGANRSLFQMVLSLRERYNIVPIIILPDEGEFAQYLKNENIEYIIMKNYYSLYLRDIIWHKNLYFIVKGIICEMLNIVISLYYSFIILKQKNITLVHTNTSTTNIGAYLAFFLKIKHIWHVREFIRLHYKLHFPWGYKIQRFLMRNMSDMVVPISKSVQKYLINFIDDKSLNLIYNGIEIPLKKFTKEKSPINIIVVGLIHPSKRQLLVVRAISKLIYRGFNNIHLTITGNYDPLHENYLTEIKNFIANNNLKDYITFTGYVQNVADILCKMHIGVLASENEAFGRVTVEYMLSGLIPIVANSGGSVEIVSDGIDGFIFNDEDDLVEVISKILNNKEIFLEISRKAYQTAIDRFSIEKNVENIYSCYKQILQ